jgi:hypothetical protein
VRFSFELSGRSRLDLVPQGRARATTATPVKLALVLYSAARQDEVRSALQACCGESGDGSGESESGDGSGGRLRSWLTANDNLEVWSEQSQSGTVALRLTGARSYGTEENLRLKYAVHLDAANETLFKCINSFGNGVVALPLWLPRRATHDEGEAVLAVAIAECVQLASAVEAIEFAITTTFKVNFGHVSLCGCE